MDAQHFLYYFYYDGAWIGINISQHIDPYSSCYTANNEKKYA